MSTVIKRAGTGWITGRDRARLTKVCVRRYHAGTTVRAIAGEIGGSYGLVYRLLTEAGVVLRARGPRPSATS